MWTIEELNRMNRETFREVLGPIFEHSPWVAERAWFFRPFASLDSLHETMVRVVSASDTAEKLALIRAHPELGAAVPMGDLSQQEQRGAGLSRLTPEERELFQTLNRMYREKFGFPFIMAVRGLTKEEILQAMQKRLHQLPDVEFGRALAEIAKIARFRLEEIIKG